MIIIILKYQGGSAMSWNVVLNQYIEIKEKALAEFEEHKDELLDKLQEVIKQAIKDFVASKINR